MNSISRLIIHLQPQVPEFMKNVITILVTFVIAIVTNAQNYKPIDTADYAERKVFIKEFKKNNETFIKSLKDKYSGKTGKELSKVYSEFGESFVKELEDKNFTFKSGFDTYLQKITVDLRKQNANIPQNLTFLIARNNFPNAYCMPNGLFVINTGLFNWIDNKEQLLGIIAHEFSHKILEHNLKMQLLHIETDKKNESTVLTLREEKYNRTLKAFDAFKKQIYSNSVIKRKHEIEADSLGYVLYKSTNSKKIEFVNALKNLQDFDTISPKVLEIETYKKLYNLPKQAFNENWLKSEDFSTYNYNHYKEKIDKDSVSTHPELDERISRLKKNFTELATSDKSLDADEEFEKYQKIARMEIIPNLYLSEDYGAGIYSAMHFLQKDTQSENEAFVKDWLGKCFLKIYDARKAYQLNRYLDRVDPKNQSKSYQQFLNFMWNLKLDEIKNIADYYNKKSS